MNDKISTAIDNLPSKMSSTATATQTNQAKQEKRQRKKSKVTKRFYVGEQGLGAKVYYCYFCEAENTTLHHKILLKSSSNFSFPSDLQMRHLFP